MNPSDIRVPAGRGGVAASLLGGRTLPHLAARIGASMAADGGGPWRVGKKVVVAAHAQVREVLARDLDFVIAPINAGRIGDVDGSFVLGMDRDVVLVREREALYRALAKVDLNPIFADISRMAAAAGGGQGRIDVVGEFARPIAAHTARTVVGLISPPDDTFKDAARSVFHHTFLNLSNDPAIRDRALRASALIQGWFDDEIARRRETGALGEDMMGALLRMGVLDGIGVRRTLAGVLVGAIDTTASAVAKIIATIGHDGLLAREVARDVDDLDRLRGWCWEALRRWPHNPLLLRSARADTVLGGVAVRAGDQIFLWTQAAMLDPGAFPEPETLRPDRPIANYLHFGDALHACAGRAINAGQIPLLVAALVRQGIARVERIKWAGPFPDRLEIAFL